MKKSILIFTLILAFLVAGTGIFFLGGMTAGGMLSTEQTAYLVITTIADDESKTCYTENIRQDGAPQRCHFSLADRAITENGETISIEALERGDILTVTYTGEPDEDISSVELPNVKTVERFAKADGPNIGVTAYGVVIDVGKSYIHVGNAIIRIPDRARITRCGEEIDLSDIQVGDFISYTWSGLSTLSYPASLSAEEIELLEPALSEPVKELRATIDNVSENSIGIRLGCIVYSVLIDSDTIIYEDIYRKIEPTDLSAGDEITIYYRQSTYAEYYDVALIQRHFHVADQGGDS